MNEEKSNQEITNQRKIDLIKYLANFYFKDKIVLSADQLLMKINDICYCESKEELEKLSNPRS